MAKRSGINIKKSNQGKLRKAAKAEKGKKIPSSKLQSMKKNAKTTKRKRQIQFAINARKWKKGGKRR